MSKPGAGEALLTPVVSGVSSLDALALSASSPHSRRGVAITLGSEFVARVDDANAATDQQRDRLKGIREVGGRVVGDPSCPCGACELCRKGIPQHCLERTELGVFGRDGALADGFVLPILNLHPVPEGIDDDHAAMATAVAAAQHAAAQLHLSGKTYITVLGDSAEGMLCAQLMARKNASVRLIGERAERLEICAKWGVRHRLLSEIGRHADQDIVVDCTGDEHGLTTALQLVRPRGQVLLKSPSNLGVAPTDALSLIAEREIQVIGSRRGPLGEALRALENGEVDVVSLISRRMRLDQAAEGLAMMHRGEAIKVLVSP